MLTKQLEQKISGSSEFLTCACLLVRNEVVKEVGILDNRYFLGGEEWDYSRRLSRAGFTMRVDSGLKYWHHVSASIEQKTSLKYIYNCYRTKLLFMKDQRPLLYCFWFLIYLFYSRVSARRQFKSLDQSLIWSEVLSTIKIAEKDNRAYSSIELEHLSQFM